MKRDLLTIRDLSADEIHHLIERARGMKAAWYRGRLNQTLRGRTMGLIFTKPSTRTRVSFEAAMIRLGGQCIFLTASDSQLSRGEPLSDTARVMSRYVDVLVIRTYAHSDVEELARYAGIPIINGLTDLSHPCQVLSDLMTIKERRGSLDGLVVAWVGDGNNVAHSWVNAAAILGFTLYLACPPGYAPNSEILERGQKEGRGRIVLTESPMEAVASADVLYTDVWASMGQEGEAESRREVFRPYQINSELLAAAPLNAMVLHCLPAHRGEEITAEIMEEHQSEIFDQAENRLHMQMALLEWLLAPR